MSDRAGSMFANIVYRLDFPEERLDHIRERLYRYSAIALGAVLLLSIPIQFLRHRSTPWVDTFTHSLLETYCGIISLVIAYVIYREYRTSGKQNSRYLFLGFLSMGVFDFFHAYSNHCAILFVWFHTMSAFSGSVFFLLSAAFSTNGNNDPLWLRRAFIWLGSLLIITAAAAISRYPTLLPSVITGDMLHHTPVHLPLSGRFTTYPMIVSLLSALCFAVAGFLFSRRFHASDDLLYHVFSLSSFLFFESGLLFSFSMLWNPAWWYWHVIKLIIFVGLVFGFAYVFRRTFRELHASREKLAGLVGELQHAYENLKNTQKELLEAEKLASIGKLAATVSHEIRNPLGAIKNSVGIFKHHSRFSKDDGELLDIIEKEIGRLDKTISHFHGRPSSTRPVPTSTALSTKR